MEQKTPLYDEHVRLGGKIVPFAGWLLPVQYPAGVLAEHNAVRGACGLFDVSHMGEFVLKGPDAVANLNRLLTNDYTVMTPGRARYSPMCNDQGGTVDDLIVYKKADTEYFIVVNAANKDKDFAWMQSHLAGDATLRDISADVAQIALQGPLAERILRRLADAADIPEKNYTACFDRRVQGIRCIVSHTGYTGEDGFELYLAAKDAPRMWNLLLDAGQADGILPCGLGARDTLRLEASMPLYGHELADDISPLEANLDVFVKLDKLDFIGKAAMLEKGAPRTRVGLKITGRGIVREHEPVWADGRQVGVTTSGTFCPHLNGAYAMALVDRSALVPGAVFEAETRGRRVDAELVPLPFYKRRK